MKANLSLESIITFLLDIEMFSPLDVAELSEVVSIMDIQNFYNGQRVFEEGDIGDGWHVIYSGKVVVEKRTPFHPDQAVAELGPGVCFGEMAILDDAPRSATVVAIEKTTVFRFSRRRFEKLLSDGSVGAYKLVYGIACTLAERQRLLNKKFTELRKEMDSIESSKIA